jgi:hypothetical protein
VKKIKIRRALSRNSYAPDAVLDLQSGALLRITGQRLFEAKFDEDSAALWAPALALDLEVRDDMSEEGEHDGARFTDRFEIKISESTRDELGLVDDKQLRNSSSYDFTDEQRETLLNMSNWTIRSDTKLDSLMLTLYGKAWEQGKVAFNPEDLVGKEIIARVSPRTGKRQGSFCEWNSFVNPRRPEKKKAKKPSTTGDRSDTIDLTEEELAQMEEVFPDTEIA